MTKDNVTDLSEYKEGWRDMPDDLSIQVEEEIITALAHCYNVPDTVERLREILDRANFAFESKDDLVAFIKKKANVLEIDEDGYVSISGDFIASVTEEEDEEQ
jgi:DNA-binding transcriptional regulator/RsmH inhibitor MraZ